MLAIDDQVTRYTVCSWDRRSAGFNHFTDQIFLTTRTSSTFVKRPGTKTSALELVDDGNKLAYSTSMEENCRILENVLRSRHGAVFAPQKCKLI